MEKIISERLHSELAIRGWSLAEFADKCELPLETVKNIFYGKTADPKVSTLLKMGDVLGLSVNCLLGKCPHTKEEREIVSYYRQCGRHGKSIIRLIAKFEATSAKAERDAKGKHTIPCLLPRGEVRKGIIYDMCETEYIETSVEDAFVAVQMTDNDLAPVFCRGDIIMFEDRFPEPGEIAAFFKKDRAYIRKFVEENGEYRLKSLFPHGEDIVLKRLDEMTYIGTCIGVVRS